MDAKKEKAEKLGVKILENQELFEFLKKLEEE